MTTRHWIEVATLVSAMAVTGAAIAQDTDRPTSPDRRSSASGKEAPASGAIVMPDDVVKPDRAPTLGDDNTRAGDRSGVFEDNSTANGDRLSVDPGPSNDDMTVDPGRPSDETSVDPGRPDADHDASPHDIRGE
jgi:hypothetical protein